MISIREAQEILISMLVLSVALTIALSEAKIGALFSFSTLLKGIVFFSITVGTGFVVHELAHKFTAQYFGAISEFRMWTFGLFLALITSLFGFVFAAPGAAYAYGKRITKRDLGIIALAGPLSNLFLVFFFAILAKVFPLYLGSIKVWEFASFINIWLGMFNLIPIHPLDGAKILEWNFFVWLLVSLVFFKLFMFGF